jgi:mannosylglycerate hydrolase
MDGKKITGFIITAGHLDIEWYQPLRSYRFWTMECFSDLKEAAARDDFTCYVLDGQVFPLEEYLEVVPEDEAELRELIKKGKLSIGPFYTQFDEWLPSPESVIRNCLWGKRRAEVFGAYMRAGYLPDNFGHPRQLPQILRGFGIDSLLFMRGMPEVPGGNPDEFMYRGIDGSEVMVSHFRETYAGAFDIFSSKKAEPTQPRIVPYYNNYLSFEWHKELADHDDPRRIAKSLVSNVHKIKNRFPSGVIPLVAGFDHLPPQINIGDSVKAANESQDDIEFIMGTAEEYIERLYEAYKIKGIKPFEYSEELLGSRFQWIILGVLNTHCYLKHANFACEALMERYVEPLDALASLYGYKDKPRLIDEAWRYLLINSAHDSIHGNSVDEVHQEMKTRYASVKQIASGVIHEILAFWGQHSDHWWERAGGTKGIIVYAPIGLDVPQVTELWLPVANNPVAVKTKDGRVLPTQILPREEIEINSIGKPRTDFYPYGVYRRILFMDTFKAGLVNSYALVPAQDVSCKSELRGGDNFIENECIRVETDGGLIRIFDKKNDAWYHNLNLLEEEADAGDATDFAPPWLPGETVKSGSGEFKTRLVESGPVRAVLEIQGSINVPLELNGDKRSKIRVDIPMSFTVTLLSGVARVDVRLRMENTARDHRIRLRLMPNLRTDFIRSQSHFAVIDRPVERPKEIERWHQNVTPILPFREWLAVQDESHGLCIAVKGMYDYEANNNSLSDCPEIAVTLLRGYGRLGRINIIGRADREGDWATNQAVETPGAQCMGIQDFEWAYIPFKTDENDKAPFLPLAQAFLYPPVSHGVRAPLKGISIPEIHAGFEWNEPNIQFSAFKHCYNRDGYMLRFYENQGRNTRITVVIKGFSKAYLSDLDEKTGEPLDIQNSTITVDAAGYKIISIKLVN